MSVLAQTPLGPKLIFPGVRGGPGGFLLTSVLASVAVLAVFSGGSRPLPPLASRGAGVYPGHRWRKHRNWISTRS